MNKKLFSFFFLIIFITGCVSRSNTGTSSVKTQQQIESAQELDDLNSKIFVKGVSAPVSPADYVVGPADLLEVKIFEADRLSDSVRVSSTGKITLPLLGAVDVVGLTARETEIKIEDLFRQRGFIRDPHVSVFVEEYKSKQVSVIGAVNSPGTYELLGRQTLLEALALSEGLAADAGRSAYITRILRDGERQSFVVDVDSLIVNNNPELNIPIEPGDIIFIPKSGNIFLEGAVAKTGAVPIKQGRTTLSQAVAMSGGLASFAQPKDVKIIRYLGNGKREIIQANLKDIRNGKADDIILKDRDAVIVETNGTKKFFTGLNLSLGFGLVGVGYTDPAR